MPEQAPSEQARTATMEKALRMILDASIRGGPIPAGRAGWTKQCPTGASWTLDALDTSHWASERWASLRRRDRPVLVQCITNAVAMDITANVLLACRCSPAMVSDESESGDFARGPADALLVNVGTLSPAALAGARAAASAANASAKPWVLDPVAMGGTPARSAAIVALVRDLKPTVIKGNGSEMIALAKALGVAPSDDAVKTAAETAARGVDCAPGVTSEAKARAALAVAAECQCVAVVTGETDFVFSPPTDSRRAPAGEQEEEQEEQEEQEETGLECHVVESGSELLPAVTATGCALGALIAAFLGSVAAKEATARDEDDARDSDASGAAPPPGRLGALARAAASAVCSYSAAAAVAEKRAAGPGSFRVHFIDALWNLSEEEVTRLGRMSSRKVRFRAVAPDAADAAARQE